MVLKRLVAQLIFLQSPGFPHPPLYPVPVDRLWKILLTDAEPALQQALPRRRAVKYPAGPNTEPFPFFKKAVDDLPAFQPFLFPECEFPGQGDKDSSARKILSSLTEKAKTKKSRREAGHMSVHSVCGILFQFAFVGNAQLFTSLAAAAGQYFTSIGRCHAFAKTVNALAAAAMRLKCTFHGVCLFLHVLQ